MSSAHTDIESRAATGTVAGAPKIILQLEAAGALAATVMAYARNGGGWLMFVLLFLVPDISMLGYLSAPGSAPPSTISLTPTRCRWRSRLTVSLNRSRSRSTSRWSGSPISGLTGCSALA